MKKDNSFLVWCGAIFAIIGGFLIVALTFILGLIFKVIEVTWKIGVFAIAIYLIYLIAKHFGVF